MQERGYIKPSEGVNTAAGKGDTSEKGIKRVSNWQVTIALRVEYAARIEVLTLYKQNVEDQRVNSDSVSHEAFFVYLWVCGQANFETRANYK